MRIFTLFPLDEIEDEFWHLLAWDKDMAGRRFVVLPFLSENQSHLDDEASDPFEQDYDDSHLGENTSVFHATNFRFCKDTEVILGR